MTSAFSTRIFWAVLGNVIGPVAALATAPLLALGLGASGRGVVAGATAPLLFVAAIGGLGLPEAVTYWSARHGRLHRRTYVVAFALAAVAGALLGAAVRAEAPLLAGGDPHLRSLIDDTTILAPLTVLSLIARAAYAGAHAWRALAIERGIAAVSRLGWVGLLGLTHELTPRSATWALLVSPVVSVLTLPLAARPWRGPSTEVSLRELTSYGGAVWLGSLSGIVLTRATQLAVVPLSDTLQAGLMAVALTLGEIPLIVSGAIRDVVLTAESAGANTARATAAARGTTAGVSLAGLAIGATAPWWIQPLFGAEFDQAIPALILVLLSVVVGSIGSICGAILSGRGHPGLRSLSMSVAAVVNLAVLVIATPRWGATGAALSVVAGATVATLANLWWAHRRLSIRPLDLLGLRRGDVAHLGLIVRRFRAGKPAPPR